MSLGYEVFHPDVNTVVRFYCDVLQFELVPGSWGQSPQYAVVRRGGLRVGCSEMSGGSLVGRRPPHGSEIVLRVDDVHAMYARVKELGWPLADELATRPWGMADFRLFDPTGQYIRVTD